MTACFRLAVTMNDSYDRLIIRTGAKMEVFAFKIAG